MCLYAFILRLFTIVLFYGYRSQYFSLSVWSFVYVYYLLLIYFYFIFGKKHPFHIFFVVLTYILACCIFPLQQVCKKKRFFTTTTVVRVRFVVKRLPLAIFIHIHPYYSSYYSLSFVSFSFCVCVTFYSFYVFQLTQTKVCAFRLLFCFFCLRYFLFFFFHLVYRIRETRYDFGKEKQRQNDNNDIYRNANNETKTPNNK